MSGAARPGRVEARLGHRPHTAFGHDDDDIVLSLLTYRSTDGHTWDALLARPRSGLESGALSVVVHGAAGNFLSGVPRRLAFELAGCGFPALSINTRMANFGAVYGGGLFDRVPADLDGALRRAAELGFETVVMVGYGLGATAITHHQAALCPPSVAALVTLVHPASLPDSLKARWARYGASPGYAEMVAAAGPVVDGHDADDIVYVTRGAGPTRAAADAELWTYRTWWASRGPQAVEAVSRERIPEVTVPVLLIEPGGVRGRREGDELRRAAGAPAHLELLPDVDRTLWDAVPDAAGAATRWLVRELPQIEPHFSPPPPSAGGTRHQLVTLVADDGTEHDALLHHDPTSEDARRGGPLAVLHVHGNQGNLTVGTLRFLPDPVAACGCAMMVIETRLANSSQLVGRALLPEALGDLRAAVDWLRRSGYERIVLSGYSLGAVLAVRLAAESPPWLAGLMTMGADWSLPETSRARMTALGAEPSYEELVERCRPIATAGALGDVDDPVIVVRGAFGREDLPRNAGVYTARTWWASRGPEAVDAMPGRHIGAVRAPILLVQGTDDSIADPVDAERLAAEARRGGNDDVAIALVDGVGHSFHGGEERVSEAVTGFLRALN